MDAHPAKSKTICLNMIVKNESKVIERCLASIKDIVDYWIIVDTGSTDGTQKIIKKFMKDIPGELHQRPWVNFEHNRNEALALAKGKGDYLFFIDADEQLVFSNPFIRQNLDKDYYFVDIHTELLRFKRILLVNNHIQDWMWKGVLHECLTSQLAQTYDILKGVTNITCLNDGYRSQDPKKHHKDIEILEKALQTDPTNNRYVFFLAQSYLNAKEHSLALKTYEKHSNMSVPDEERYWSLYMLGELQELLNMPSFIDSYCKAYLFRPSRAEPLFRLAQHYTKNGNEVLGYVLAKFGLSIPMSPDGTNVLTWIYDYGFLCVLAEASYRMGKYHESEDFLQQIAKEKAPTYIQQQINKNLRILKTREQL